MPEARDRASGPRRITVEDPINCKGSLFSLIFIMLSIIGILTTIIPTNCSCHKPHTI